MSDALDARIDELEGRVRQLEYDLRGLSAGIDAAIGPVDMSAAPSTLPPPPSLSQQPVMLPPPRDYLPTIAQPGPEHRPALADSETALKWGGVGLVVLAIGFAVSTAIRRGWIGPELQLAGAVAASLALILAGLHLRPSRMPWTHALCSGGVAALFTTFASNLFLDQSSHDVAYACTAVAGLAGFALARQIPSEWVASVSLLGGLAGWLVIGDGEPPFLTGWVWAVGLVTVTLLLSLDRRWFALRFLGHGVGLFAFLGMADNAEGGVEQILLVGAAALLCASLVRLPSIGDLSTIWQQLEIQVATLAGPWALAVIVVTFDGVDGDTRIGSVAIAVAVAFTLVGLGVRSRIARAHFVSVLIAASVTLSIGLALLLSTTAAIVAIAVQGAGLVLLSRALADNIRVLINAAILELIAVVAVTGPIVDAWSTDASIGDDIGHLAALAGIAVAGWTSGRNELRQMTVLGLLALLLVWLGSILVHLPQGQAVVSISWAMVGTAVLVTGAVRKIPELGAVGLTVLALTVVKLLTVDLHEVDTLWRAALFFLIGTGIMRLGFLLPRLTGDADDQRITAPPTSAATAES